MHSKTCPTTSVPKYLAMHNYICCELGNPWRKAKDLHWILKLRFTLRSKQVLTLFSTCFLDKLVFLNENLHWVCTVVSTEKDITPCRFSQKSAFLCQLHAVAIFVGRCDLDAARLLWPKKFPPIDLNNCYRYLWHNNASDLERLFCCMYF
jgi:hypothetical protein